MSCNCNPPGLSNTGKGPIIWIDNCTYKRLAKPLYPSVLVYGDDNLARWGNGASDSEIKLPNLQESTNNEYIAYLVIQDSNGVVQRVPVTPSEIEVCPQTPGDPSTTITVLAIPNAP